MRIEELLRHFEVVHGGGGQWMCRCPAHDDARASLSIGVGKDGKILVYDQAGCRTEDVLGAVGLTTKDLFPEREKEVTRPSQAPALSGKIEAEYLYTTDLKKVKVRQPDGGKFCYWQCLQGGRWMNGRNGVNPPLYTGGKDLEKAVFMVEGEKDVETLLCVGYSAATLPDGASSKWRIDYSEMLRGRDVTIIQDNDEPGKKYAQTVANKLHGVARSVKVIDLTVAWKDMPAHADITDMILHFGTKQACQALMELMKAAPEWQPDEFLALDDFPEREEVVKPADFSDAGNAESFIKARGDDLLYADALGFACWDGKRYALNEHIAMAAGIDHSAKMLSEARAEVYEALHMEADAKARLVENGGTEGKSEVERAQAQVKQAKAYLAWAERSRQANALRNMLELSKPALHITAGQLDANPWDLCTPSGIVDLQTGNIRSPERAALCTKMTRISPGDQGANLWEDFLKRISGDDPKFIAFLQTLAGMCAVGKVFHEGILLAVGNGRNGKSTFFNAVESSLGDYAGTIDATVLTTDRQNKGAALATLRGKRFAICGEFEEGQRLSVATLKRLASTDPMTIEEKFRQPETIIPSHHLCLFTNFLPRVGSTDGGTWRRLTVVPFNATMPSGIEDIPNYAEVLVDKAGPAILEWIIEGAVMFRRSGCRLYLPDAVEEATDAYREREDWLKTFLSERCTIERDSRVGAAELYSEYRNFATDTRDYVRRLAEFNAAMEEAGFEKRTPGGKKVWLGLHVGLAGHFEIRCSATG